MNACMYPLYLYVGFSTVHPHWERQIYHFINKCKQGFNSKFQNNHRHMIQIRYNLAHSIKYPALHIAKYIFGIFHAEKMIKFLGACITIRLIACNESACTFIIAIWEGFILCCVQSWNQWKSGLNGFAPYKHAYFSPVFVPAWLHIIILQRLRVKREY